MQSWIILGLIVASASASVVPWTGWEDYGHHHHHHHPVATSYASVWKVDHSVPVWVKPAWPAWNPWWDPHHDHHHHDHHDHHHGWH
ncbi:uncharacterized protein DDB_G0272720-like [Macrosteles quadrilineatus]|uniref:uncharacterized protein DDB_G0272720-like n=1 Tax=Macrosteles quadrilineatus TaxID=74068 RepID=UPI0023E327F7|nr:uncharacterized protein DDB_G0272720-like [Macrosteles quadrilineatus]